MRDDPEAIRLRKDHQQWMIKVSKINESLQEAEYMARSGGWIGRLAVWLNTTALDIAKEHE